MGINGSTKLISSWKKFWLLCIQTKLTSSIKFSFIFSKKSFIIFLFVECVVYALSSIAGNAKNKRNRPTSPCDFSATAGTKNLKVVPKLVLELLYVDILLVWFCEDACRTMLKFFVFSQKWFFQILFSNFFSDSQYPNLEKTTTRNPLLPANFSVPVLKVKILEKISVVLGCDMVNFGGQYLQTGSDFVQHIYTHSKGFLISFSKVHITILSYLQLLNYRPKCRKTFGKILKS